MGNTRRAIEEGDIKAGVIWLVVILLLALGGAMCSGDLSVGPEEKEPMMITKECDQYIRAAKHRGYWTSDHTRIFTYDNYINFMDGIDRLEQVGIIFINSKTDSIFYIAQGGFFKTIDAVGYASSEVTFAESGDTLYVYSYISVDTVPEGIREIYWVNLEWSNDIPFDSVKAIFDYNYKGNLKKQFGGKGFEVY
jgi:hypothetical protein